MSAGGDWQAGGAVQGEPVPVGRLAGEGQAGEPGQQRGERDLCLQPGERGAQAVMDPAAERQRRLPGPVQDQPARLAERLRVAVGCPGVDAMCPRRADGKNGMW